MLTGCSDVLEAFFYEAFHNNMVEYILKTVAVLKLKTGPSGAVYLSFFGYSIVIHVCIEMQNSYRYRYVFFLSMTYR